MVDFGVASIASRPPVLPTVLRLLLCTGRRSYYDKTQARAPQPDQTA
jgi:hypothetical protein